jgi:hypothetical protein
LEVVNRRLDRGTRTSGPLVVVLSRAPVLDDKDVAGVRHVRGRVPHAPHDEAVRPLLGVTPPRRTHRVNCAVYELVEVIFLSFRSRK